MEAVVWFLGVWGARGCLSTWKHQCRSCSKISVLGDDKIWQTSEMGTLESCFCHHHRFCSDCCVIFHLLLLLMNQRYRIKGQNLSFSFLTNIKVSVWRGKICLKVLLRSKFDVKFVTKTLSFQLIRSDCTCFGHWSELWRPLSENIELENVGFSRPPLQIYVPVTKPLFSDCDVIFWTRQENKPEPWENSERFSKLRSSSPDSGIVKEEIIDYDDSLEPAPTEYEKVKY